MISKRLKYILIFLQLSVPIFVVPVNSQDIDDAKKVISCEHYMSQKKWLYDDFIFTSSGSTFYTYKNGFLHQWSLGKSINHEKSIMIGIDFSKYKHKKNIDFIFLNNDESKMIFWTEDFFEIWDIKKEKRMGRKNIKTLFATTAMSQNIFFTFDKNNILRKWNIESLKEEKSIEINFGCETWDPGSGTHAPFCKPIKLVVVNNYIYAIAYNAVVKVNIKEMKELKRSFISACVSGNISLNKKTFYCNENIYDLSSLNKSKENINKNPKSFGWARYFTYNKLFIGKSVHYNKAVLSLKNIGNKNRLGIFLHNDKGNWIIRNRPYFDTDIQKEELKMSCGDNRKILPMTKKVYEKSYKNLNLKELIHGND